MTIAETVVGHFERTWEMYQKAISSFPEEQWRSGDIDYLIPARLVYHAVEAADFYSRVTPEGFAFGHRFGADWEGATSEQLPTQEQTLAYLDEMRIQVDAWLRGMADSDLLSPDTSFHWTGGNFLARALYLLRHNQHHLGELNAEFRRRGLPRAHWR